jgi:hypothetical protein
MSIVYNKMWTQKCMTTFWQGNLMKTGYLADREADGKITFSDGSYGNGSEKEGRGRSESYPLKFWYSRY